MPDLREQLRAAEPEDVGFDMADVHRRASAVRRRQQHVQAAVAGLVVLVVVAAGAWSQRPQPDGVLLDDAPAPAEVEERAVPGEPPVPPPAERRPDGLWLSHTRVASTGQAIAFAGVAPDEEVLYGPSGTIERWLGGLWEPVAQFATATDGSLPGTVVSPGVEMGVEAIGYTAGGEVPVGPVERLALPWLQPGWHRLVKPLGDGDVLTAPFEVVDAAAPVEPALDGDRAQLRIEPDALLVAEAPVDGDAERVPATIRWSGGDLADATGTVEVSRLVDGGGGPAGELVLEEIGADGFAVVLGGAALELTLPAEIRASAGMVVVRVVDADGGAGPAGVVPVIDPAAVGRDAAVPAAESAVDGVLDCGSAGRWGVESTIGDGARGYATAEEAVLRALLQVALRDDIHVDAGVGTVVLDGREVVRATAEQLPDGGWLSASSEGCADATAPQQPVGDLAGPCPTTGVQGGTAADVIALDGGELVAAGPADAAAVGTPLGTTGCRLQDGRWPDGYRRRLEAGQLPAGTPVHAAVDASPDEVVIAMTADGPVRYVAGGPIPLP